MAEFSDFIDNLKNKTSIVEVVGRKLSWDAHKSQPAKGDMWASCPFHAEKTASFHVDDRKGFYYCFGCHAKGNVFSFVQQIENIPFIEVVKRLADEAGMALPQQNPKTKQQYDHRKILYDIMEEARQYFCRALQGNGGIKARQYLGKRGLGQDMIERFEIGVAPNMRGDVFKYLCNKGFREKDIIEVGLAVKPEDGRAIYDRFRDRIIFPIRDDKGRLIAFGGRALGAQTLAKYLNSPQTPLFNKSRTLYNVNQVKQYIAKDHALIVCEGYMDVIALASVGFGACVAPLGTALSETQLAALWSMNSEVIFALDGDNAGLRAAYRIIEIALPLINSRTILKFCLLPEGMDPDDVVRKQGRREMDKLLDKSVTLIEMIWMREISEKTFTMPEQRAALEENLHAIVQKISSSSLRKYYGTEFKNKLWLLFHPKRKKQTRQRRVGFIKRAEMVSQARFSTKKTLLAQDMSLQNEILEDSVIAILLHYPALCEDFSEPLMAHEFSDDNSILQAAILNFKGDSDALYSTIDKQHGKLIEKIYKRPYIEILPVLKRSDIEMARRALHEIFGHLAYRSAVEQEITESAQALDAAEGEILTNRLRQVSDISHAWKAKAGGDFSSIVADQIELQELTQKMIDDRVWEKKKSK